MAKRERGHRGSGTIIQIRDDVWAIKHALNGKRVVSAHMSYPEAVRLIGRARKAIQAGVAPEPYPMKENAATGQLDPLGAKPVTFADLLDGFWAWRETRGLKVVRDDVNRWGYLKDFNHKPVDSIQQSDLQALVKSMQVQDLSPATIGLTLNLLSSFYKYADKLNPVASFKRTFGKVLKSDHDPEDTPFLESEGDAKRLYETLPAPYSIAYAISRWAGLRPGEVRGLEWVDVDLARGTIQVRWSVRQNRKDTPKSGKNRTVPIGTYLVDILKGWKLVTSGPLVVPAVPRKTNKLRESQVSDTPRNWSPYLNEGQFNKALEAALAKCKLPSDLTFYQAGRHSYASQWASSGRSIYELSKVMGHSSVTTTERYAHLGGSIKPL